MTMHSSWWLERSKAKKNECEFRKMSDLEQMLFRKYTFKQEQA